MKKKSVTSTFLIILAIAITGSVAFLLFRKYEQAKRDKCVREGGRWDSGVNECIPIAGSDPLNADDFIWRAGYDTIINREYLIKGSKLDAYIETVPVLVDLLNRRPAKCKLEFIEQQGDTARIKVLQEEYLCEQMGTTGAWCFLAETVVTLTENKETNFIDIDMQGGSHANPGIYQRSDFAELILNLDSLVTEEMEQEFNLNFIE